MGLHSQLEMCNLPFEILLRDDTSEEKFHLENMSLSRLRNVTYERNVSNAGRSRTRNLLAKQAQYTYLLFIDCDANMIRQDYIQRYIDEIAQHKGEERFVINGGIGYRNIEPAPDYRLRWIYGCQREQLPAETRNKHPYRIFTPFNLLLTRNIFKYVQFDESVKSYGNEDTLFGAELKRQTIPIYHIDNSLYHDGLDTNEQFLKKTETAVENLWKLWTTTTDKKNLVQESKLLTTYTILKDNNIIILYFLYPIQKFMKRKILKKHTLFWLDTYKLYYLHKIDTTTAKKQ